MSIDYATFVVQRGDDKFSCLGSALELIQPNDMLLVQDDDEHKQFVPRNKGRRVWDSQVYGRNSSEIPADHPAKNDPSWLAFKKVHDNGPGSEADFEYIRNMKKGDVLYNGIEILIIEDSYEDTRYGDPRIAHKFKNFVFDNAFGQTDMYINLVDDNFDILPDESLFVVTDGDNGHKSVTGAQVKSLLGPQPVVLWKQNMTFYTGSSKYVTGPLSNDKNNAFFFSADKGGLPIPMPVEVGQTIRLKGLLDDADYLYEGQCLATGDATSALGEGGWYLKIEGIDLDTLTSSRNTINDQGISEGGHVEVSALPVS